MTKHRLMLSAAAAALLATPFAGRAVSAATEISNTVNTTQTTATTGDLTIDSNGGISVRQLGPAVIINSSNFVINSGSISNTGNDGAIGYEIDTSGGDLTPSASGLANIGGVDLSGNGSGKTGVLVHGGHTYFGGINLLPVITTVGTTTNSGSTFIVQGDNGYIFALAQDTTVGGNILLGGTMSLIPAKNSQQSGATAIEIDGTVNGNVVVPAGSTLSVEGSQSRGIAILGTINACAPGAGAGCTVGNDFGNFTNSGSINVTGTTTPNSKGNNIESGSAVTIANSIAGGFLNNGPSTSNGATVSASIIGNGDVSSTIFSPAVLIDPSRSITSTNGSVLGPVIIGPVNPKNDSVDPGYAVINRGTIVGQPIDGNISSVGFAIQGSSATNFTYLSSMSAADYLTAHPGATTAQGVGASGTLNLARVGFLNTGSIQANSFTNQATTSSTVTATAFYIGAFTTVPRFVVAGEAISANSFTQGTIAAGVSGLGGGIATAVNIGAQATVPQIDVLAHGAITAQIGTLTVSPDANAANAASPFTEAAIAIQDVSGSVKFINNAGRISARTTVLTPSAAAAPYIINVTRAIDLSGGNTGGTTINNSALIEGDVLFNSGGGNNRLYVGNVGDTTGTGLGDNTGNANAAITLVNGGAFTNTPNLYATVAGRITSNPSGLHPVADVNLIDFGSGIGNKLDVGGFGYVNSVIKAAPGGVDVQVENNGQLFVSSSAAVPTLNANNFIVRTGGTLGLTITQQNNNTVTPVIQAQTSATLEANSKVGLQFGSFLSSGSTAASLNSPTVQTITLIKTPVLNANQVTVIDAINATLKTQVPFLFESPANPDEPTSVAPTPLTLGTAPGGFQTLNLSLLPRSPGLKNADGTAGLGLTGDAYALFPNIVAALGNDPRLGAAIANNLSVYKINGQPSSGLNITASQQKSQQVFSQFAPDASGGTRQVLIMITDQASGPVAARQRVLRSYAKETGELTLWGEEFYANINNKGRVNADGSITAYKDHGFGFVLGMDAGSAGGGWYGGALSYYSGDVTQSLPRSSKTNEQWYMLTGYTDWHGRHVFLDTTASVGYGTLKGYRDIVIGDEAREAAGKRAGLLGAFGATGGVNLDYGLLQILPHVSFDGLISREEGYTENGGGDGFNLQVAPNYANSFRVALGSDFRGNFHVLGANFTPDLRLAYRYDLVSSPTKLRAGFASTGGLATTGNAFTYVGPDPDTGNAVVGAGISAGTDTWHLGVHYDWVRGNHGSTTQVGTITLLGRI